MDFKLDKIGVYSYNSTHAHPHASPSVRFITRRANSVGSVGSV